MKIKVVLAALLLVVTGSTSAEGSASDTWAGYIDFAYVYSSAESEALRKRLEEYGREAGLPFDRYLTEQYATKVKSKDEGFDDNYARRRSIAYLLHYIAYGEKESLETAFDAARSLEDHLERHENRYWYRYVMAHRALERGRSHDFVGEVLDMWSEVVVPLETPFETLQTLSLENTANSGFASALPYIYENVARLVLIRSQEMGLNRDMDPLGAVVRMLGDKRVGAYPDIIPIAASSRGYVERIINRLNGAESDAGSLTFTLALFEANKRHERARELLATDGLSEETVKAIRITTGAYKTARDRALTIQGDAAVYTRVLRQLGEVYAAKQRLGVDPEIDTPFHMEDILETYDIMLVDGTEVEDGWRKLGYARTGRDSYIDAMIRLWEEIQESTLNIADYYLSRAVEDKNYADDHARNAVRLYGRYLAFFLRYATTDDKDGVPDSAYFAAHEAAKGVGDAFLAYADNPTGTELNLAVRRYRAAMKIFPFDRTLFSSMASALEHQGRESEYLGLVLPAAEDAIHSQALEIWIRGGEPGHKRLETLRRALSDTQALMYLGFAEAQSVGDLESGLQDLRAKREATQRKLDQLKEQRYGGGDQAPAALDPSGLDAAQLEDLNIRIAETQTLLERLDKQLAARKRTLPVYKATLETDGLAGELRSRRDHPLHVLLRRMYHEARN
jgi:hypothetical protein